MLRYVALRIALIVPALVGLSVAVFFYLQLIPGDPIAEMLGNEGNPALIRELRHRYGLDRPVPEQYVEWASRLMHGDLGVSFRSQQPITPILMDRLPATLQLAAGGLLVALLIALPSGIIAGLKRNTRLDYVFSALALIGLSTPMFWLGTLLLLVFAVRLGWLPSQGYVPLTQDPATSLKLMILPCFALGLGLAPYLARMTRAAVIEVTQEPYVPYARAKGLRPRTILARYTVRNAIVPVSVVVGLDVGRLLGGSIVIEEIFNWPGSGRLLTRGVLELDYFMVQAMIMVYATLFLVINLGVEVMHARLDPRVRLR